MNQGDIAELIEATIPDATADVTTRTDHPEDDHFEADVVSPAFAEKSLVEQHEMVYDALEDRMTRDIHALELSTYTPEEYERV